jgi:two-component sensor histidine kinase
MCLWFRIRLDLKVDHALVSINVAMPVSLLVNELLTNAFKHAFNGREGGVIAAFAGDDDRKASNRTKIIAF